jgi:hypothetical protein
MHGCVCVVSINFIFFGSFFSLCLQIHFDCVLLASLLVAESELHCTLAWIGIDFGLACVSNLSQDVGRCAEFLAPLEKSFAIDLACFHLLVGYFY